MKSKIFIARGHEEIEDLGAVINYWLEEKCIKEIASTDTSICYLPEDNSQYLVTTVWY
ncbi:MAG: hypothetical protein HOF94_07490 [Alphaproteobacteria bacterium]|nr:hypothetical protein [Alphaproteobacteria bacterium]